MTDAGYIAAGWLITFVGLGGYATWIVVRGKRLSSRVPPERRRWM